MDEKIVIIFGLIGIVVLVVGIIIYQKKRNKDGIESFISNGVDYALIYIDRGKLSDGNLVVIENIDFAQPVWKFENNHYEYYVETGKRTFNLRIEKSPINMFKKKVSPFYESLTLDIESAFDYFMDYDFDERKLKIIKKLK